MMLSARWTYALKYILGPLWIVLFGTAAIVAAIAPHTLVSSTGSAPPAGSQWIFLAIWIVAAIGISRFLIPLKSVELRDGRLYVSNYFREWELFGRDIESVKQSLWMNARPVRVRLRHDVDGLGSSFTFVPPSHRGLRFLREDPQVAELRRFAETVHSSTSRRAG
jgi:hypothetical protein